MTRIFRPAIRTSHQDALLPERSDPAGDRAQPERTDEEVRPGGPQSLGRLPGQKTAQNAGRGRPRPEHRAGPQPDRVENERCRHGDREDSRQAEPGSQKPEHGQQGGHAARPESRPLVAQVERKQEDADGDRPDRRDQQHPPPTACQQDAPQELGAPAVWPASGAKRRFPGVLRREPPKCGKHQRYAVGKETDCAAEERVQARPQTETFGGPRVEPGTPGRRVGEMSRAGFHPNAR